ncbi:TIGR02452 family protein [Paludisphaera rhizosphaerae]|uniref:TIGR02452 family protein n=1 Tax=Paludisphaera rhizosphaerae TaxID=2711216 RepID=UPI0013EC3A58|nr:TIGR02452 family protein [Paludisphaera rhizosphaerae]
MKRSQRAQMAEETVAIVESGSYRSSSGRHIDITEEVRTCLERTTYHQPEDLGRIRDEILAVPAEGLARTIEVVNETTLAGIARLLNSAGGPVAALNFASAKNPGGGFLNGSQAQEESLARSSALFASQQRAFVFYERHRASSSLLYSDSIILSPDCPIFRDDDGALLDEPRSAAFITCAAPNAGAIATNRPQEHSEIPETLARRAERVLALAASRGYRQIVLGAWGCGVFRNEPALVASIFARLLNGPWSGRFDHVAFSVLDDSPSLETLRAFESALNVRSVRSGSD